MARAEELSPGARARRRIDLPGGGRVVLMDSISYVDASDAGAVVVSGSHGGASSARYALGQRLAGAFFNDAGGGKDDAGVSGLRLLDARGVPAGAVAHTSARIGDAEDAWAAGVLSAVNRAAARAGLRPGQPLQAAAARLARRTDQDQKGEPVHYLLFYDVAPDYLERRAAHRDEHLALAWAAHARGELLLGGALADPVDGAVLLFQGPTPAVVEQFVAADPYVRNGLVTAWRVRPWTTVVGQGATTPVHPAAGAEGTA